MPNDPHPCRLYLISPPTLDVSEFARTLESALGAGDVAAFQLRLKNADDAQITAAVRALMPICRDHGVAFILNDRVDLAASLKVDGVHLGQEDLMKYSSPIRGEVRRGAPPATPEQVSPHPNPSSTKNHGLSHDFSSRSPVGEGILAARTIVGEQVSIGISCHDSGHLAMEAGEAGADYVAFGAFHPTTSKEPAQLAKYGTPTIELLQWWATYTVVPCVAIGGMTPENCQPYVAAGADFIAAIQAVWTHPDGPRAAVKAFNKSIKKGTQARPPI